MDKEVEEDKKSLNSSEIDNIANLTLDSHMNQGDDVDHRTRHKSWEDMNSNCFLQR